MNLIKLFEMQKALDEKIIKEKGLEGKDLLPQKILALQVELGECANEWRGFKFWSSNQKSKVSEKKNCRGCDGIGSVNNFLVTVCERCNGSGFEITNPLLEEYVDCLHFILSIGLELYPPIGTNKLYDPVGYKADNVNNQFLLVMSWVNDLFDHGETEFDELFYAFYELGRTLGFTWEQIEQAYKEKHAINIQRQVNGY